MLFGVAGPCIKTLVERVKKGKRREVLFLATALDDVNPVKNKETQQRKGTQNRSMDRFEGMTSTRCL
jgi:hypothetical protein